jgi:hypothetical protein
MKIFDYKFIILLGLTLVVYFIYREVEYLRSKINKIEKEISVFTNNTDKITQPTKPINVKPSMPDIPLTNMQTKLPVDNLDLPSAVINDSSAGLGETQKIDQLDLSLIDLYPLNVPFMDIQLLTNINLDKVIPMPDKINNLIIIDEDVSEHCDSNKHDSPSHLAVYSNDNESCEKPPDNTLDETREVTEVNDDEIKINSLHDNESVLENLNKYKLVEIKKIAEDKQININKKVNGVYKPKTKNELIMEIIELKNI